MFCVIGSGPSGIATAWKLIQNGHKVTMLDKGNQLESEKLVLKKKLSAKKPADFSLDELRSITDDKGIYRNGAKEIVGIKSPYKLLFGSDFMFREFEDYIPVEWTNSFSLGSLARAGFSNVWGGAMMPAVQSDISDWPIDVNSLEPYYRQILEIIPHSFSEDHLKDIFPLYSNGYSKIDVNQQAQHLLQDTSRHHSVLSKQGIHTIQSRLAIKGKLNGDAGCIYCQHCLSGCVYDMIYSTNQTLDELMQHPDFTYISDVFVESFVETGQSVKINTYSINSRTDMLYTADKLFIGGGCWSTTQLVLNSLKAFGESVKMKHVQYFLFPFLRYKKVPNVRDEDMFTLAQIFMEILDEEISEKTIHLQLYGYSNQIEKGLAGKFGGLGKQIVDVLGDELLGRLFIAQGFLHSDDSPDMEVSLRKTEVGKKLFVKGNPRKETQATISQVLTKLNANRKYLKGIALKPFLEVAPIGKSVHLGGTFPMRMNPGKLETDILGRPYGLENVHIVDASTFPSVPAPTYMLTTMANAIRIADEI